MIAEALKVILNANVGLAALVSTRSYPTVLPQEVTYPAIAFRLVSEATTAILETPGANGQFAVRVRFFSAAKTYKQAQQVDAVLVTALIGQTGTFAGVVIQGIFTAQLAADDFDDATETYQFVRDFTVHAVR